MGFIYDWRSTATTPTATCASGEVSRRPSYYRGEQYDSDLGLYYLRARYYNPITGRFLSRDPLAGDPTVPRTLHKYLYADGDPVDLVDATGRGAAFEKFKLTVTIVAVAGLQMIQRMGPYELTRAIGAVACFGKGLKGTYDILGTLISELTHEKVDLPFHDEPGPDDPIDTACKDMGN
jgi:RHS repeat-associated protein